MDAINIESYYFAKKIFQRNPPPSKKTKEGNLVKKDDKGKEYYELDRNRRVYVDDFKGKQYLQIREYYLDKASGENQFG